MDNLRNITPAITEIKTGTRAIEDSEGNIIITGIGGDNIPSGVNVTSTTAEASDVLSGKVFYTSGGVLTSGTISSVASATITPTTSNQVISGGVYLAGDQTVSGDANLVASNIKKDVAMFGITGTYEGAGGATSFYKCATVDSTTSTWTGYKAVLSSGVYSFESTVTSGLSYSSVTPVVGNIYDSTALVRVRSLYVAMPTALLTVSGQSLTAAETGQSLTYTGTVELATLLGKSCMKVNSGANMQLTESSLPVGASARTMSCWVLTSTVHNTMWCGYGVDYESSGNMFFLGQDASGNAGFWSWGDDITTSRNIHDGTWHNLMVVCDGTSYVLYVDGIAAGQLTATPATQLSTFKIGYFWEPSYHCAKGDFWIRDIHVWSSALTSDQIEYIQTSEI